MKLELEFADLGSIRACSTSNKPLRIAEGPSTDSASSPRNSRFPLPARTAGDYTIDTTLIA